MHLEDGADPDAVEWVESASILHSNGDALEIAVRDGRMVGVRGIARSRVNHGRLGPKDLYGWQANGSRDRLRRPLVRRDGELVESDWDTAMDAIVDRTKELSASAIGFYTTGQLFLEEYYTQAVIARAGIGTNHMDGNTRLCTATEDVLSPAGLSVARPALEFPQCLGITLDTAKDEKGCIRTRLTSVVEIEVDALRAGSIEC